MHSPTRIQPWKSKNGMQWSTRANRVLEIYEKCIYHKTYQISTHPMTCPWLPFYFSWRLHNPRRRIPTQERIFIPSACVISGCLHGCLAVATVPWPPWHRGVRANDRMVATSFCWRVAHATKSYSDRLLGETSTGFLYSSLYQNRNVANLGLICLLLVYYEALYCGYSALLFLWINRSITFMLWNFIEILLYHDIDNEDSEVSHKICQ